MADPVLPDLSIEARLQFEILRTEVRGTRDLERLRQKALQLVDMMELQRRTTNAMLRENFLKPRPQLPPFPKPADA
jgi:hypothetical protein